jgi:hypothetical protein
LDISQILSVAERERARQSLRVYAKMRMLMCGLTAAG